MNWKIIVGVLLIIGAAKEFISVLADYRSDRLNFWPGGIEIALVALMFGGILLVRKGRQERNRLRP